jgi:hypothetical protein
MEWVMPAPIAVEILLTDDEREVLEAWTSRRKTAQALALRARIVLAAASHLTNREIAELEGCVRADGHEVAQPVRRPAAGRLAG